LSAGDVVPCSASLRLTGAWKRVAAVNEGGLKRSFFISDFSENNFRKIFEKELASRSGTNTVSPPFRKEADQKVGDTV
jgi:hypothetical protein